MFTTPRLARQSRNEATRVKVLESVHEAGHAVGRLWTATALGLTRESAVAWITFDRDGTPTTWGPRFGTKIDNGEPATNEQQLMKAARVRGVDVAAWARAKSLQIMMGPAGEAKFTSKPFRHVWFGSAASNDRNDLAKDCALAGICSDDTLTEILPQVESLLSRSEVWDLVLALGRAVRASSGLSGAQVANISRAFLPDLP